MNKRFTAALGLGVALTTIIITGVGEAPQVEITVLSTITDDSSLKAAPFSEHAVVAGDTLSGIASKHGIDTTTLAHANGLNINSTLRIGRPLLVPAMSGAIHTVKRGDTLWDVARGYGASVTAIVEANPQVNPSALRLNEKVLIPGVKSRNTAVNLSTSTSTNSGTSTGFSWPASGRITSAFGPRWGAFHAGIDLGIRTGTNIRSSVAGTVTFSGRAGGYGLLVKISHSGGYETRYAHNSKLLVKPGDKVTAGQIIALSGNTGNSTGPHLHFEIRKAGVALNPMKHLR
ncbi:MAG: peptidase M23 [Bacillota bacterium]|nr:MAG: peptidase M23 [Bacillota bacterium]MBS3949648.1 M23 family metallopeptidase [Peptococcaceae bacterium]